LSVRPSAKTAWTQSNLFQQSLKNIGLQDFTLRRVATSVHPPQSFVDGITLQQVIHGFISHVRFEAGIRKAIRLNQTRDVTVEYVAIDNGETRPPSPLTTALPQSD
jgi:hypothetical protein